MEGFLACFFFNDTATTEIYTLSLHDALPISGLGRGTYGPPNDLSYAINSYSLFKKYSTIRYPSQCIIFCDDDSYFVYKNAPVGSQVGDWHSGNFNAAFADGHAEFVNRDEFWANQPKYLSLTGE